MARLTWLHISDWHQKGADFDRQVVRDALIKDITKRVNIDPSLAQVDFIVFSGDLAFNGKPDEYVSAQKNLLDPILQATSLETDRLFIGPGNHDLNREHVYKMLPVKLQEPLTTDAQIHEWLDDSTRSRTLEPFEAYRIFVTNYTNQPSPDYASIVNLSVDNKKVAILGLNSAWMCARHKDLNGEVDDARHLIVGEPQIHNALAKIADADIKIAVMHHPFEWLTPFDRDHIEARLGRECHFILRGHEHQSQVHVMSGTGGDCVIIPAGASYDRRIAENPRHTCAYNFVHLDFDAGEGRIYLRRWSDQRNEWVEDIDAYPGGNYPLGSLPKNLSNLLPDAPAGLPPIETHTGIAQTHASGGPLFPIFEVPHRRNPNFTGREQVIAELRQDIIAASASVIPQVVTGLGGIGKTQIAVEYAYQYSHEYDLVWWIRAEDMAALSADYMALANRLELPVKTNADQRVFANIVRNWLGNTTHRWLLILDNVTAPEDVTQLLPARGNGHILITSQNPEWRAVANVLPHLKPFTSEEARTFLLRRTGQTDQAAADKLATLLGYLPLALAQAGAFMAHLSLSIQEYVKLYESKRHYLWQRETAPEDYTATVTTTWELAFQRLKDSSPEGIALLNLCIFLSPDDVPLFVFRTEDAYLPTELAADYENPLKLEEAVASLNQYSLVERHGESLSIHRLVQEVARDRLGTDRLPRWVELAVNLMSHVFTYDKYDMKTWPLCARLLPHALAVVSYAEEYKVALPAAAAIWQKTAAYLRKIGEFDRAHESIDHALTIRTQVFGEDHELYAESLDYLGELCQEQAHYDKAYDYHQRALAIRQKRLGRVHADTAWSLNNLGSVFLLKGQYAQSREYNQEALAIRQQVLGELHPDTAYSFNNLGMLFLQQGQFEQAHEYFEVALAIRKQVLGEHHPDTANSLNSLGGLFHNQGKYEQAREYFEAALAIRKQVLGEQHPDTANSLNNLGGLFSDQGKYAQAGEYFEAALAIRKQVLGEQHPNTATSLNNLGALFSDQGKYEQAHDYYEAALSIRKQVLGEQHPDTANSLNALGGVFHNQGKYEQAREYFEAALAIRKQVLGEQHPDTANSLNNLGALFSDQGEYEQAREYYEAALAIRKQVLGDQHSDTAKILNNLGALFRLQGKNADAKHYLEQALSIYEKLETKPPTMVTVLTNLASVMVALRQFEQARRYVTRAIDICQESAEEYKECQELKQLRRTLPGPIGRSKKNKRRR